MAQFNVHRFLALIGLLALISLAVLLTACDFHYRAAITPVEDEIAVWTIPTAEAADDPPVHISSHELESVLQEVRVNFKGNWLQNLITGPLESSPLFDSSVLARVAPPLAEALEKVGSRERVIFYVAQRRGNDRRDVTSGSLFVNGRSLIIELANYQNRVDVIPGLMLYDRTAPEMAVAPQRFSLDFSLAEYTIAGKRDLVEAVFEPAGPKLTVNYSQFLQDKPREKAKPSLAKPDRAGQERLKMLTAKSSRSWPWKSN